MAQNRSTANSETYNDITLTVSPNVFTTSAGFVSAVTGAVGVNTPNPTDGTFEISDVAVRNIGAGASRGNLASAWEDAARGSGEYSPAQFYREGSRIFMDGALGLKSGELYSLSSSPTILTLPPGFRPITSQLFVTSCFFSRSPAVAGAGDEYFSTATVKVDSDGTVKLISVSGQVNGTVPPTRASGFSNFMATTASVDGSSGRDNHLSFSGINFRCTD